MRGEAFFSGADLLNSGRATQASCLILDLRMPNLDGLELQRRLKEIRPSIPVIFFSAHAGKEEEDQALRSGAVAFLRKPVHRDVLLRVIRMALDGIDNGSERRSHLRLFQRRPADSTKILQPDPRPPAPRPGPGPSGAGTRAAPPPR